MQKRLFKSHIVLLLLLLCSFFVKAQQKIAIPATIEKWIDAQLAAAANKKLLSSYDSAAFFSNDSARIIGYLKGYKRDMGFATGIAYCSNEITNQDMPIVVEIYEDGRFEAKLPMNNPKVLFMVLKDVYIQPYIEPGQTLALIIDWPAFAADESKKYLWYKGPAGNINNELNKINNRKINYQELFEKDVVELAPMAFYTKTLQEWDSEAAELTQQFKHNKFSPQTQIIARSILNQKYGIVLYDFEMNRGYMKMSDSTNKILQIPIPNSYYDFVKRFDFNDRSLLVGDQFSTFINRYEFSAPFKQAQQQVNKISGSGQDQALRRLVVKDSVVHSFYDMQPNLIQDIALIRNSRWEMKYMLTGNEARQVYTKGFVEKLSNPYLKKTAIQNFDQIMAIENGDGEVLPNNKAAAIFKKIIEPYQGKVLFIDFWATTCGPCVGGIKQMYDTRLKYKDNPDFEFLFVTSEDESPKKEYDAFVQEQKLINTVYLNIDDYRYLRELFAFNGIPRYVVIKADGKFINNFSMHNFNYELGRFFPKYSNNPVQRIN